MQCERGSPTPAAVFHATIEGLWGPWTPKCFRRSAGAIAQGRNLTEPDTHHRPKPPEFAPKSNASTSPTGAVLPQNVTKPPAPARSDLGRAGPAPPTQP
jgi:hypothetical protein